MKSSESGEKKRGRPTSDTFVKQKDIKVVSSAPLEVLEGSVDALIDRIIRAEVLKHQDKFTPTVSMYFTYLILITIYFLILLQVVEDAAKSLSAEFKNADTTLTDFERNVAGRRWAKEALIRKNDERKADLELKKVLYDSFWANREEDVGVKALIEPLDVMTLPNLLEKKNELIIALEFVEYRLQAEFDPQLINRKRQWTVLSQLKNNVDAEELGEAERLIKQATSTATVEMHESRSIKIYD